MDLHTAITRLDARREMAQRAPECVDPNGETVRRRTISSLQYPRVPKYIVRNDVGDAWSVFHTRPLAARPRPPGKSIGTTQPFSVGSHPTQTRLSEAECAEPTRLVQSHGVEMRIRKESG